MVENFHVAYGKTYDDEETSDVGGDGMIHLNLCRRLEKVRNILFLGQERVSAIFCHPRVFLKPSVSPT